ncbi:MAG TPA: dephospho-CoA kinase [Stellaceae bacterium]|jgi:dephospho-CoA kinase|nr:dephospho-CoA kinase [Stellaceae bacterium]
MKILGLTGSVGMGKSTAALLLRRMGVPVFDADAAVHRLLGPGGAAVALVAKAFAGVKKGDAIDRIALGKRVFADGEAMTRLEAILHPRVRALERRFLRQARSRGAKLVVLDIPLLYETHGENRCDAVLVVWAPPSVQRDRVLRRPGMDGKRLKSILAKQLPSSMKRRRADFAVPSGLGLGVTWRGLRRALDHLRACGLESEASD